MAITLKAARVNAGLTVSEVAEKMNVTRYTIQNWENEKVYPSIPKFAELCKMYGCDIGDIFFSSLVR